MPALHAHNLVRAVRCSANSDFFGRLGEWLYRESLPLCYAGIGAARKRAPFILEGLLQTR